MRGRIGKGAVNAAAAAAAKGKVLPVVAAVQKVVRYVSGGMSPACLRVLEMAEELVDNWPHTVPHVPLGVVAASKFAETAKLRGVTEEGGRMAVGGQGGWAFFDYHLAMFGPQDVPLGPFRLQMAMPPFGCDPGFSLSLSLPASVYLPPLILTPPHISLPDLSLPISLSLSLSQAGTVCAFRTQSWPSSGGAAAPSA